MTEPIHSRRFLVAMLVIVATGSPTAAQIANKVEARNGFQERASTSHLTLNQAFGTNSAAASFQGDGFSSAATISGSADESTITLVFESTLFNEEVFFASSAGRLDLYPELVLPTSPEPGSEVTLTVSGSITGTAIGDRTGPLDFESLPRRYAHARLRVNPVFGIAGGNVGGYGSGAVLDGANVLELVGPYDPVEVPFFATYGVFAPEEGQSLFLQTLLDVDFTSFLNNNVAVNLQVNLQVQDIAFVPIELEDEEDENDDNSFRWINVQGGEFDVGANWSGGEVPGPQDVAVFDIDGSYTVTLGAAVNNHSLDVKSTSVVTFDLGGNSYNLAGDEGHTLALDSVLTIRNGVVSVDPNGDGVMRVGTSGDPAVLDFELDGRLRTASFQIGPLAEVQIPLGLYSGGSAAPEHQVVVSDSIDLFGGGQLTSARGVIEGPVDAPGHFLIRGEGSRWRIVGNTDPSSPQLLDSELIVGGHGHGLLTIMDGGHVDSESSDGVASKVSSVRIGEEPGSSGTLVLEGAGSRLDAVLLTIGDRGQGMMSIQSGATVRSDVTAIGNESTGSGHVLVRGPGSQWEIGAEFLPPGTQFLTVSDQGEATLEVDQEGFVVLAAGGMRVGPQGLVSIHSGGQVEAGGAVISGAVEVHGQAAAGAPSRLQAGVIEVGVGTFAGENSLTISNSGQVVCSDALVGNVVGSHGTVVVTGAGSRWDVTNTEDPFVLLVGGDGQGTVTVEDNATVHVPGSVGVALSGTIALNSGGSLNVGSIAIGTGGQVVGSGGQLVADTDCLADDGVTAIPCITNNGLIAPGLSVGTLSLEGSVLIGPAGILELEIAGTMPRVEQDQLVVDGDLTIEGNVLLKFIDGFAPLAGQEFGLLLDVHGAADVAQANFIVQNLADDFEFDITPMDGGFLLTALTDATFRQAIDGDYNNDGQVEQGDLDLALLNWGEDAVPIPAGWVHALPVGTIDQAELDSVLLNWGNTASVAASANSVPAPATGLLGCVALVVGAACRLRRRN